MTGGTRGLGRAVVDRVLALPDWRIILFARGANPLTGLAPAVASRVDVVAADLADLRSVQRACSDVRSRLGGSDVAALALNAGLQSARKDPVSADGFELHFAVNHLAHVLIADQLAPHMDHGGRIVVTTNGLRAHLRDIEGLQRRHEQQGQQVQRVQAGHAQHEKPVAIDAPFSDPRVRECVAMLTEARRATAHPSSAT